MRGHGIPECGMRWGCLRCNTNSSGWAAALQDTIDTFCQFESRKSVSFPEVLNVLFLGSTRWKRDISPLCSTARLYPGVSCGVQDSRAPNVTGFFAVAFALSGQNDALSISVPSSPSAEVSAQNVVELEDFPGFILKPSCSVLVGLQSWCVFA